jgi:hypothetical protein
VAGVHAAPAWLRPSSFARCLEATARNGTQNSL